MNQRKLLVDVWTLSLKRIVRHLNLMARKLFSGLQVLSVLGKDLLLKSCSSVENTAFLLRVSTLHILYYAMLLLGRHDVEQPAASRTTQVPGMGHKLCQTISVTALVQVYSQQTKDR